MTDLRAIAENATPGPWFLHENDLIGGWCVMQEDVPPSQSFLYDIADFAAEADAAHTAAFDPPTVLAMLDIIDAARTVLDSDLTNTAAEWSALSDALDALDEQT